MPVAYWVRFGVSFAVLFAATGARGASIEISPLDSAEQAIVSVSGPFEAADTEHFRTKTSALTKAIVVLASDGGSLVAGIEIGTLMRLKGFASLVPDGSRCASACALAWLGGSKRFMGATAQIGFHAAYVVKDGLPTETSSGNAIVGAYLNRIGLPDRAVIYITDSAPQEVRWLSLEDAELQGIDVSLFSPASPTQVTAVAPETDAPPAIVREFYEALGGGNGQQAANFILPEKRKGPFSPEAMTKFYGNLVEPIKMTGIEANGANQFLVHYSYRRASNQCNGLAMVTTTNFDGHFFISRIKALSGC